VWAPASQHVTVRITQPARAVVPLAPEGNGYFAGFAEGARSGARYLFQLDGSSPLPDPASRFQPEGVHGPSEVIDPAAFTWTDSGWTSPRVDELVIYELHIGTFSDEGTFEGAARRLPELVRLGVTAVEIMPVADFPGCRNWGYDGVDLFAPSRAYGRPDDLRRLVDAAHGAGLAVLLDVVYNHLGPEGAYLASYAPAYFTDRHRTPWGNAINLDGPDSPHVRRFFIENALHWLHEYHVDGFRLDATHALIDDSSPYFLQELATEVRRHRAGAIVIAEDERKPREMIRPLAEGGWGLDGVWADDLHHHLRRLLAGDREGYFARYDGTTSDIARTVERGWFFRRTLDGRIVRADHTGNEIGAEDHSRFVVCLQNHDQVGNRALGDRLHHVIEPAAFRAATALLLTAPETPLIFMGQEWGASSPFQYFTDLPEPLGGLVTEGRRAEFGAFAAFADPASRERIPDPQDASTFERSRLRWDERHREPHAAILRLYEALLALRRTWNAEPGTRNLEPETRNPERHVQEGSECMACALDDDTVCVRRGTAAGAAVLIARLRGSGTVVVPREYAPDCSSRDVVLSTEDAAFTADPVPPAIAAADGEIRIAFARPGAVVISY
jgi:maltooligosyltrehalose trehalohydrolase